MVQQLASSEIPGKKTKEVALPFVMGNVDLAIDVISRKII